MQDVAVSPAPMYSTGSLTHVLHALHMSDGSLTRASSLLRTQAPAMVADALRRLAKALSSRFTDSWSDAKCARLVASHLTPSHTRSSSPSPPPPPTQRVAPAHASRVRVIVRLVPADKSAENEITCSGNHPFVEVALRASKTIWDVAAHLFSKWGLPLRIIVGDSVLPLRTRLATLMPLPTDDATVSPPMPVILASFQLAIPHIPPSIFKAARSACILPDAPPTPPPLPPSPIRPPPAAVPTRAGAGRRTYATPPCLTRKKSTKRRASGSPPCSPPCTRPRYELPPNSPVHTVQRHDIPTHLLSPSPSPSVLSSPSVPLYDQSRGLPSVETSKGIRCDDSAGKGTSMSSMHRSRSPSFDSLVNTLQTDKPVTTSGDFIDALLSSSAGSPSSISYDDIVPKPMLSFGESEHLLVDPVIFSDDSPSTTNTTGQVLSSQGLTSINREFEEGKEEDPKRCAEGHDFANDADLSVNPAISANTSYSPTFAMKNSNERCKNLDFKVEADNRNISDPFQGAEVGINNIPVPPFQFDTNEDSGQVLAPEAFASANDICMPQGEKEPEAPNESVLRLLNDFFSDNVPAMSVANTSCEIIEPLSKSGQPHRGSDELCAPEPQTTSCDDVISMALALPMQSGLVDNWGLETDVVNGSCHNEGKGSGSGSKEDSNDKDGCVEPDILRLLDND